MYKLVSVAVAAALSASLLVMSPPASAALDVAVSVNVAPPELPVYDQPEIPGPGYIWTPGYWAWADDGSGYYWVPGTWVLAPEAGFLWTPGWWGWDDSGAYLWHAGYWGPTVGFYGGVNYGYGYFGRGFDGGYWDHGAFRYNTAYTRIGGGAHIANVYNRTTVNNITINNHVSFNGGHGGIESRPSPAELEAEHGRHLEPVSAQIHQREVAHDNPDLRLSANHGHPGIAATARPGEFQGRGVVAAHDAPPAAAHLAVHQPDNAAPALQSGRGPDVNRGTEANRGPSANRGPEAGRGAGPEAGRGAEASHAAPPAAHVQPRIESRPPEVHNAPPPTPAARVEAPHSEPHVQSARPPSPPAQQREQPHPAAQEGHEQGHREEPHR